MDIIYLMNISFKKLMKKKNFIFFLFEINLYFILNPLFISFLKKKKTKEKIFIFIKLSFNILQLFIF
jgi:hypothetical protein